MCLLGGCMCIQIEIGDAQRRDDEGDNLPRACLCACVCLFTCQSKEVTKRGAEKRSTGLVALLGDVQVLYIYVCDGCLDALC